MVKVPLRVVEVLLVGAHVIAMEGDLAHGDELAVLARDRGA